MQFETYSAYKSWLYPDKHCLLGDWHQSLWQTRYAIFVSEYAAQMLHSLHNLLTVKCFSGSHWEGCEKKREIKKETYLANEKLSNRVSIESILDIIAVVSSAHYALWPQSILFWAIVHNVNFTLQINKKSTACGSANRMRFKWAACLPVASYHKSKPLCYINCKSRSVWSKRQWQREFGKRSTNSKTRVCRSRTEKKVENILNVLNNQEPSKKRFVCQVFRAYQLWWECYF